MYTASNYYDKDSVGSEKREEKTWISRFCSRQENCYFCKVDYEFISDSFNLFGINNTVHLYRQALDIILDNNRNTLTDSEFDEGELEANAVFVYGLIHARYILTTAGLEAMEQKFKSNTFGSCPRVCCKHQHLLPIGESDNPGVSTVKLFCPCCKEIYYPPPEFEHLDGAFFGTSFPHLFLLNFPEYKVKPRKSFEPTIYGYKIHQSSPYYNVN